ncbi:MAG: hypothetical protein SF029_01660 [bacterium]|nr:hypothetical protein [bacterium]
MRFWEDMQSKWGFSDGNAVPDGIEVYREIYIRAVNKLAEQLGSSVRLVAYDRFGLHNWCLILMHRLSDLQAQGIENFTAHVDINADTVGTDEAMEEAIRQADELELDGFVEVSVSLAEDFEAFMTELRSIAEGDPLIAEVNSETQHFYPGGRIRLVQEVAAFDRSVLPIGAEYIITWVEHRAWLLGITSTAGGNPIAFASAFAAVVLEIPAEIRADREDCTAVPPYHLRDLEDETLDTYGQFDTLVEAETVIQAAANTLGKAVQLINGYGNTVASCGPDEKEA